MIRPFQQPCEQRSLAAKRIELQCSLIIHPLEPQDFNLHSFYPSPNCPELANSISGSPLMLLSTEIGFSPVRWGMGETSNELWSPKQQPWPSHHTFYGTILGTILNPIYSFSALKLLLPQSLTVLCLLAEVKENLILQRSSAPFT